MLCSATVENGKTMQLHIEKHASDVTCLLN